MTEEEYYASEISDAELDAIADAGDFLNDEQGLYCMPTQAEMQAMASEGRLMLLRERARQLAEETGDRVIGEWQGGDWIEGDL